MTAQFPFDHAGKSEMSLMMALCPEAVDTKRLSPREWYTRSARQASPNAASEAAT